MMYFVVEWCLLPFGALLFTLLLACQNGVVHHCRYYRWYVERPLSTLSARCMVLT